MSKRALGIAKKSLRECYDVHGIKAGMEYYTDHWARDSFYASWGALEVKDYAIVKKNLRLFLKRVRKGQVPLRIGIGASVIGGILSFVGIRLWFGVRYNEEKWFNPAMDPNPLLIITAEKYLEKTKDKEFIKKNLNKLQGVIEWMQRKEKNGLIYGGKYATWQDSVKKRGYVMYTNCLYYRALLALSNIMKTLGLEENYSEKAEKLKKEINKKFWNKEKGHYLDYFSEKKKSQVFSSDGNFFSIIFGIADKKKTNSILKKAKEIGISKDVPSYTNFPRHRHRDIYTPLYLLDLQVYNDYGVCWTWLGSLHTMALVKAGKKKEAKKVFEKLSGFISKEGEVYETYESSGVPFHRFFYKSEHPFAWSAGFYILAQGLLNNSRKKI